MAAPTRRCGNFSTAEMRIDAGMNSGSLICHDCGVSRTRRQNLLRHLRDEHGFKGKPSVCPNCSLILLTTEQLRCHLKSQHADLKETFVCYICGKELTTKHSLTYHLGQHSDRTKRLFQCGTCDFKTPSRSYLKRHEQFAHRDPLMVSCPYSPERKLSARSLGHHIRWYHEQISAYDCFDCEKRHTLKMNLVQHSLTHMLLRRERDCCKCGKRLRTLHEVWTHSKKNRCASKWNRPTCFTCGFQSGRKEQIFGHFYRKHQTEIEERERFYCFRCSYSSLRKAYLSEHDRMKHGRTKQDAKHCFDCHKQFSRLKFLRNHQENVHHSFGSAEVECPHCGELLSAYSLCYHVKSRKCFELAPRPKPGGLTFAKWDCFDCGTSLIRRTDVVNHQKFKHQTYGDMTVSCARCQVRVRPENLAAHLQTVKCEVSASGMQRERPLACFDCSKAFAISEALATHQRQCHQSLGESRVVCERCQQSISKGSIYRHVRRKRCGRLAKLLARND